MDLFSIIAIGTIVLVAGYAFVFGLCHVNREAEDGATKDIEQIIALRKYAEKHKRTDKEK